MAVRCLVAVLAVAGLLAPSLALYAEQAGSYDWHKQLVGAVSHVAFDGARRQVIVATADGLLAAVDASGSLAWRVVQREKDVTDSLLLSGSALYTLDGASKLRQWDAAKGTLVWEALLRGTVTVPSPSSLGPPRQQWGPQPVVDSWDTVADLQLAGKTLYALANDTVFAVRASDGSTAWKAKLETSGSRVYRVLQVVPKLKTVSAIASSPAGLEVTALNLATGESVGSFAHKLASAPRGCRLAQASVFCLVGETLVAASSQDGGTPLSTLKLGSKLAEFAPTSGAQDKADVVVVRTPGKDLVVSAASSQLETLKEFVGHTASYAFSLTSDGAAHLTRTTVAGSQISIDVVPSGAAQIEFEPVQATGPAHVGPPSAAWVSLVKKTSGGFGALMVARTDDNTLLHTKSNRLLWARAESLAQIQQAEYIDLPAAGLSKAASYQSHNPVKHYLSRITSRVDQLKSLLLKAEETVLGGAHEDAEPRRDLFNEHKYIVTLSATGSLAALDTFSGAAVWQRFPRFVGALIRAQLVVTRKTAYGTPICAVVATTTQGTEIHIFNPLDGKAAGDDVRLPSPALLVAPLGIETQSFVQAVAIVTEDQRLHVFPDTAEVRALVRASPVPRHLFRVDATLGVLTGYQVTAAKGGDLGLQTLWALQVAGPNAKIEAVATKNTHERVSSLGEVLSDGNVMYKYLNPSQITVATLSNYTRGASVLSLFIIDVVKGKIIEKVYHENVVGPVHVTQSENWVAYHFRNRRAKRYELHVLEMYEANNKPRTEGFSSHDGGLPIVLSQAYILPTALTAAGASVTEHGITAKMLVVATPAGSIAGYHRNWVSARRPLPKSAAGPGTAVGLPPYHPILASTPAMNLNYHLNLQRIRRIETAPSGLESTSLVFCHGLDLFYTKVFPSKKFDVLNEDFNHPALGLTLAALAVLTYVLAMLNQRRRTQTEWK